MTQSQTLTFTNRTTSPFRYDIVGSFLRPAELKAAREKFANKEITKDEKIRQLRNWLKKNLRLGCTRLPMASSGAHTGIWTRSGVLKALLTLFKRMVISSMMKKHAPTLLRLSVRLNLTVRILIWKPSSTSRA